MKIACLHACPLARSLACLLPCLLVRLFMSAFILVDNRTGDEESHVDHSTREFFVIKLAYQVYLEYQKQLYCDTDGES